MAEVQQYLSLFVGIADVSAMVKLKMFANSWRCDLRRFVSFLKLRYGYSISIDD